MELQFFGSEQEEKSLLRCLYTMHKWCSIGPNCHTLCSGACLSARSTTQCSCLPRIKSQCGKVLTFNREWRVYKQLWEREQPSKPGVMTWCWLSPLLPSKSHDCYIDDSAQTKVLVFFLITYQIFLDFVYIWWLIDSHLCCS